MVKRHCYVFLSCLFLLPWSCFGQSRDWLDISPADLVIKQVPGDPGAPAIQLYYADYPDDNIGGQNFVEEALELRILRDGEHDSV